MRRRFFIPRFDDNSATLSGDAAHHLARVLRASPGQLYELSDGRSLFLARIDRVSKSSIHFSLVEQLPAPAATPPITLLLAVVKFDRFEWALEKATELGVSEIIPLAAARSDAALLRAATKRSARWQKILFESAQQSRRLSPPLLHPLTRPADAFANSFTTSVPSIGATIESRPLSILLSERPAAPLLRTLLSPSSLSPSTNSAALAIGPEGGWTDDEFSDALRARFLEASLGPTILRTETAVTAALAILAFSLPPSTQ